MKINFEESDIDLLLTADNEHILQKIDEIKTDLISFLDNLADQVTVTTTDEMIHFDGTLFEDKDTSPGSIQGVDFTI